MAQDKGSMKERLDVLVTEYGLAESRQKAKALIMAGLVFVDNQREDKAGTMISKEARIEVRGQGMKYVSRGGYKLEKAINVFGLTLEGLCCMDVGASTGGFTDCMLQNGASHVWSVDVGYGQFSWKLRQDPRVTCMEKTNIRYVVPEDIGTEIAFVSIDVSFISLAKVLPAVYALMQKDAQMVCLIKPQFEAGREKVGKKGVVRDAAAHYEVITRIGHFAKDHGFAVLGIDYSPIRGPEGNIEYLLWLQKNENQTEGEASGIADIEEEAKRVTKLAHKELNK